MMFESNYYWFILPIDKEYIIDIWLGEYDNCLGALESFLGSYKGSAILQIFCCIQLVKSTM